MEIACVLHWGLRKGRKEGIFLCLWRSFFLGKKVQLSFPHGGGGPDSGKSASGRVERAAPYCQVKGNMVLVDLRNGLGEKRTSDARGKKLLLVENAKRSTRGGKGLFCAGGGRPQTSTGTSARIIGGGGGKRKRNRPDCEKNPFRHREEEKKKRTADFL